MSRPGCWSNDALIDLVEQVAYIATDNLSAARHVADGLDKTARTLGGMPIGRPGRVTGLPSVVAYAFTQAGGAEEIAIVRVIHTSHDWSMSQQ